MVAQHYHNNNYCLQPKKVEEDARPHETPLAVLASDWLNNLAFLLPL